jgi:hypothetical protein
MMTRDSTTTEQKSSRSYWGFVLWPLVFVVVLWAFQYFRWQTSKPFGPSSMNQPTECIGNLQYLLGAKDAFAQDHRATNGQPVSLADVGPYIESFHRFACPAGGKYDPGIIGSAPVCSFGTNRVVWKRRNLFSYIYSSDSGNMHRLP